MKMKDSIGSKSFNIFNYIFMFLISLTFLYPFWYVIIVSLNDNRVTNYQQIAFWPSAFTFLNYLVVLSDSTILNGYKITILRTITGVVFTVLANSMIAYGLSKKYLFGRKFFLTLITITMFFSGGLIPSYLLYMKLGIINKFAVYILPALLGAWTIIIMKTFFSSTISVSIEESARIDGANDMYIFFKIILPLSTSMLATIGLFAAVGHWNDWWVGEIMISDQKLKPVQTILLKIINQTQAMEQMNAMRGRLGLSGAAVQLESVKMAAIMVVTLPILIAYPFCQKYFVKGVMIGSIKE